MVNFVATAGVVFPAGARDFYFLDSVRTGSGAHPASYPMGTEGSSSGGKAAVFSTAPREPGNTALVFLHLLCHLGHPSAPSLSFVSLAFVLCSCSAYLPPHAHSARIWLLSRPPRFFVPGVPVSSQAAFFRAHRSYSFLVCCWCTLFLRELIGTGGLACKSPRIPYNPVFSVCGLLCLLSASGGLLFSLLFDWIWRLYVRPNIGWHSPDYTALYRRR
jgi:hypothetical protein